MVGLGLAEASKKDNKMKENLEVLKVCVFGSGFGIINELV